MKGLLKSLESIIAVLIVFTVFITYFAVKEPLPEFETINWQLKGFNSLQTLDETNQLYSYVKANDTDGLESRLSTLLPKEINYKVLICGTNCPSPGVESEKLTSIAYVTAGEINNFQPMQVVIYIYRVL